MSPVIPTDLWLPLHEAISPQRMWESEGAGSKLPMATSTGLVGNNKDREHRYNFQRGLSDTSPRQSVFLWPTHETQAVITSLFQSWGPG